VFRRRFIDIGGYDLGWVWNVPGTPIGSIFTVLHYKISKIYEEERWLTIISILGKEYVRE
jgi:hypothetical protein